MGKKKISIIFPAYQEEEAIVEVLERTKKTMDSSEYDYEIIVVDDGSTDSTSEKAQSVPGVKVVRHESNRGVGAARNTGILAASGSIVVFSDADGTYPVEDIPKLVKEIGKYDMVIGARIKESGTLPWLRKPVKDFIRKLASWMSEVDIPDLNSGLRAIKKNVALRYMHLLPEGHSWVSTITLACLSDKRPVKFIPIDYHPRKGKSTFHPIKDTMNYLGLVIRCICWFNPLKVFLPITLISLTVTVAFVLYHLILDRRITLGGLLLMISSLQLIALTLIADMIAKTRAR